jgi:uncharacterized protein (TIGR02145 family)
MKQITFNNQKTTVHIHRLSIKSIVLIIIIHYSLFTIHCFSQVGINATGANPNSSAILDVSGTNKGLLINRMTTAQRNAIVSPANSLLIFNTSTNCFEAYVNGSWFNVSCPAGCIPPSAPVALAATNRDCTSFTASWNASSDAMGYYLDVSTDAGFSNFVTGYNNINAGNSTSYNLTGLTTGTTYYYQVRAASDCVSNNSNVMQTYCACPCSWNNSTQFPDTRDGKYYKQVQIGTQCWMAENLNYGTYEILNISQTQQPGYKYCYEDDPNNCSIYGGLYIWDAMMNGSASCNGLGASQPACNSPVQGICPPGWHIPSHYEYNLLLRNAGSSPGSFPYDETSCNAWFGVDEGSNLKEAGTSHWVNPNTGTNKTGFTLLGAGMYYSGSTPPYVGLNILGQVWTSTAHDITWAWFHEFYNDRAMAARNYFYYGRASAMSVRCVKN